MQRTLPRLERDLVLGEAEGLLLDVRAGDHRQHAGQRRARVVSMRTIRACGMARAEDLAVGQARQVEIVAGSACAR